MRRKVVNPGRWRTVGKGEADYNPAVVRTIYQMINDDVAVDIAKIESYWTLPPLAKTKRCLEVLADKLKNGSYKED